VLRGQRVADAPMHLTFRAAPSLVKATAFSFAARGGRCRIDAMPKAARRADGAPCARGESAASPQRVRSEPRGNFELWGRGVSGYNLKVCTIQPAP
jgi:hypothetical protein